MSTAQVPLVFPADVVERSTSNPRSIQNGRPAQSSIAAAIEAVCAHVPAASRWSISGCAPGAEVDSTATSYYLRLWLPHYAEHATVALAFSSQAEVEVDISVTTGAGGSASESIILPSTTVECAVWTCEVDVGTGGAAISETTLTIELDRTSGGEITRLEYVAVAVHPALPELTV